MVYAQEEMMLEYELSVETDEKTRVVRLRLTDPDGVHCGSHRVMLADHPASRREVRFDTRRYVERYAGSLLRDDASAPDTAENLLDERGVFLATAVLGSVIVRTLGQSKQRLSLVVRLPVMEEGILASAFACVPWEIARRGPGERPLMARNLVFAWPPTARPRATRLWRDPPLRPSPSARSTTPCGSVPTLLQRFYKIGE
jgi:hypothetical protein